MQSREVRPDDLFPLLELYSHLHDNPAPELDERIRGLWRQIHNDSNHHIVVGVENGVIVSSCVVVVVPNLTHGQQPYALIENVITHPDFRGRGYATQVLHFARDIAKSEGCYKIMLLTGSKEESTLRFYERAGYNKEDKTAFIQWLE